MSNGFVWQLIPLSVADPGFPVGGANLRRLHFLAKMYVKTKEIDPVGGARAGGTTWIRQCLCLWISTTLVLYNSL